MVAVNNCDTTKTILEVNININSNYLKNIHHDGINKPNNLVIDIKSIPYKQETTYQSTLISKDTVATD